MKRRSLSVLLALVMCLSLLPTAALAEADEIVTEKTQNLYSHTYKLTEDVTLDKKYLIVSSNATTLDLNGHVLTGHDSCVIRFTRDSSTETLTLIDSDPTAEHYFTVDSNGRWSLCTAEGCTHETCRKVTGGCIVGDTTNICVNVSASEKTFIMEGGNLIGGQNNGSIGVQVTGSFTMKGGSIQGCKSPRGSVVGASGAKITLGGDNTKTVTIADTSAGGSGVWLDNAYNGSPAAKLTVGEMKDVPSFTVQRKDGAKLTYVGDLDLTTATTLPNGVSWDSSKNELTLDDVYCRTVKLPNLEPKDTTIKGRGYADWVGCVGNASGKLIFDDADFEAGSIMWHDTNGEDGHAVVLQNDSHLTVSGADGMYIGALKIEDTSELTLSNSKIMSLFEGRIDDLKYYLADGTGYAAVKPEDPQQGVDYTLTKDGNTVTSETFRRYCEVTFYPGTLGYLPENVQAITQRVPYGSNANAPTATPNDPDRYAFTGWQGMGKTNGQTVNDDVKITDEIEYDAVEFTAQYDRITTKSFAYTNNVVLGGTAKPTAQEFELEVIYSDHTPMTTATVGGNKTEVTATTTFNKDTTTDITQAALTGTLTLKGLSAQLAAGGGTFPCFVRQKAVTADGWTTAPEAYLLAYDTQGEQEESPTLKIYPAEEGADGTYEIQSDGNGDAAAVGGMTFTNTYTGYNVTWDGNGGDEGYTPNGATTKGVAGDDITAPTNAPTRAADASNVYSFAGWYTAAEGGEALTNTATIPQGGVTYYAHWNKTPIYNVTFNSQGGSDVSPQKVVSGNKAAEPTEPTKSGYSFGGWYSDASLSSAYDFETAVTGDLTLYARWMSNSSGTRYTIKASAGEGGSITPSGNVSVRRGAERSFTITPALGYAVRSVLVDGKEVGALTSYSFKNVRANHTISVTFQCNLPTGLNYLDHTAYVQGYPDGTVLPNGNITRAETAMMLYRLLTAERRAEIETSDCDLTDVSADAWYRTAAATMAAGGYLEGYADGSFGGDRSITRAEFIAALVRFLGVRDVTCSFSDVPTSHWSYAYIATATDAGWINGANGAFRPDDPITRAEAMAVINRALCRGVDAESELLTFKGYPDNVFGAWYYYEVLEATNGHEYTGARPSEDWTRLL